MINALAMKTFAFYIILGSLLVATLFGCSAKNKTVLLNQNIHSKSQEELNKEKEVYIAQFNSMGFRPNWVNKFYEAGINLDKYDELLAAGVDLKEYPSFHLVTDPK